MNPSSDIIWLHWNTPEQLNGILQGYQISYYVTNVGRSAESVVYTQADILEANITGLRAYTNYSIIVRGRTVEYGANSNIVTVLTKEGRMFEIVLNRLFIIVAIVGISMNIL